MRRRRSTELYLEELVESPLKSTVALRETLPSKKEKEEHANLQGSELKI
jgi:hypothetical protein